jgi:microcystin-dependent protein
MTLSVKHKFHSIKGDGADTTLVKPSDWNNEHDFLSDVAAGGIILGRDQGTGPGPIQELPYTSIMPTGVILPFAGATAPTGFLLCQGQSLLRGDYAALFSVIGTTYGSADATHFNVPDLRGRIPCGLEGGSGRVPTSYNTLGAAGGEASHVLSTAEMPIHNHSVSVTIVDPGHQHQTNAENYGLGGQGGGNVMQDANAYSSNGRWSTSVGTGIYVQSASAGNAGSGGGHNVMQPTIAINYIIRT